LAQMPPAPRVAQYLRMRKRGNGADESKSPRLFQTKFALLLP